MVTVMNLNVRKHCAKNNRFHIKKTNKKGRLRLTFLFYEEITGGQKLNAVSRLIIDRDLHQQV